MYTHMYTGTNTGTQERFGLWQRNKFGSTGHQTQSQLPFGSNHWSPVAVRQLSIFSEVPVPEQLVTTDRLTFSNKKLNDLTTHTATDLLTFCQPTWCSAVADASWIRHKIRPGSYHQVQIYDFKKYKQLRISDFKYTTILIRWSFCSGTVPICDTLPVP